MRRRGSSAYAEKRRCVLHWSGEDWERLCSILWMIGLTTATLAIMGVRRSVGRLGGAAVVVGYLGFVLVTVLRP